MKLNTKNQLVNKSDLPILQAETQKNILRWMSRTEDRGRFLKMKPCLWLLQESKTGEVTGEVTSK
jgi:hypothetical protein